MTYLQLHDGPESFPSFNGRMQPLVNALNPYAPGAPVVNPGPFRTFAGCSPADVKAQFIPQSKAAWAVTLDKNKQYQQIWTNAKSLWAAMGTGSKPVYNAKGEITGYAQATKGETAMSWLKLGIQIGQALKGELDNAGANRLTADAQAAWDSNLWGIAYLCEQDLPTLYQNAQKCYDAMNYWLIRQSEAQIEFKNEPIYNIGKRDQLNSQRRIANRAVTIRQTAFRLLTEQIADKGGAFTPGQAQSAQAGDLSKLLIPAALTLFTLTR
jgi:hypothetical protein